MCNSLLVERLSCRILTSFYPFLTPVSKKRDNHTCFMPKSEVSYFMALSVLYPETQRLEKRLENRGDSASLEVSLWSVMTCPNCGCSKLEAIPKNEEKLSYTCAECKTVLEPAGWECCVYCSYGSVRCAKAQSRSSSTNASA